ncbi:MAG: hypothetical protein U0168_09220 [Nannocystaceae bacterium]
MTITADGDPRPVTVHVLGSGYGSNSAISMIPQSAIEARFSVPPHAAVKVYDLQSCWLERAQVLLQCARLMAKIFRCRRPPIHDSGACRVVMRPSCGCNGAATGASGKVGGKKVSVLNLLNLLNLIKVLIVVCISAIAGCKTEDKNWIPVDGAESGTSDGVCETDDHCMPPTTSASTAADSSGGECGGYATYTCRGWHAGVYVNGSQKRFDFEGVSDGEKYAGCENFEICIEFAGLPDNEAIYAACKEIATGTEAPTFPLHPYTGGEAWTFDHIEFVFADNASFGAIPGVTGSFLGGCSWVPESSSDLSKTHQVLGGECLPEDECPAEAQVCLGWSPGGFITSSTNTATRTITTSIDRDWLEAQAQDFFDAIVQCDGGTWTWSTSATPDKWRMQGLLSRDFMYKAGFRNYDEQIRIKKAGSSTWYNLFDATMLDGYDKMAAAFGALAGETSFVLELKRGSSTYTMNLTLI